MPKHPEHRIILTAVFLIVTVCSILLLVNPAAIFPDSAWGYQVLRSVQNGSGFNMLTLVSQENITQNTSEFKSWWSPGQYLFPAAFVKLFNLNLGYASALTVIICQFTGLAGLYVFFKKAGFSKNISALSLVVIMVQQAFFTPYIFYNGGEILLFGFIGWFLYGCLQFNRPGIALAVFILLCGWIGFFAKSSFIWMYGAGLIFIWIQLSKHTTHIKHWLINGFWIGIPALISVAIIYITYLSKGVNPSSQSGGIDLSWKVLAFPLASPLLAGFSADDLANGFITHNDTVLFTATQAIAIITVLALLSVWLVYAISKRMPDNRYNVLLVIFYIVAVLFFGASYLQRKDISYESRHFRVIGLLIIPGTVYLFSRFKRVYQYAFGVLILFISFFTLRFYILSYIALKTDTARGTSGIAQQFIDQASLDYITMLDKRSQDALFVFFSPDLGLEIKQNRIITLEPLNGDISIDMEDYLHKGHAGPIYILMPHEYIGIRASVILKAFPGYKGFSLKELSDDYVLYFATQAR
ncbi:hypothetical protein ACFQZX_15510 [Mucilaginibacter litoreus]|uniref:Glycosyltransferase RgtA/B/C/D-like domain-containing protein n=1 Tax=Mucilaginibacter litoreus TaxID=1048221 RepID=A0ABW3AWV2_9SPHI